MKNKKTSQLDSFIITAAALLLVVMLLSGCVQKIDHTMIALDKDHKPFFDKDGKPVVAEEKSSLTFGLGPVFSSTNDKSHENGGNWSAYQPTPSTTTTTRPVVRPYILNPDGTKNYNVPPELLAAQSAQATVNRNVPVRGTQSNPRDTSWIQREGYPPGTM